jgi:aspartyl/asparaginyl-tRNA synthetase
MGKNENYNSQNEIEKKLVIDPCEFHKVVHKLREFFTQKGYFEVHTQNRLSILAACEDPSTINTFQYAGLTWPLPQTGQMWLEYELLKNPEPPGYFCVSTSYRNEPNPVPNRHDIIFPMFEFELKGDFEELIRVEKELLEHLGYNLEKSGEDDYLNIAEKYNTKEVEHSHEMSLYEDYGSVFFLKNFPEYTSPFWNMKRNDNEGTSYKCDVILSGQETIGSAERSCDVERMRHDFLTISEGEYSGLIYSQFGKERVDKELENFFDNKFMTRSGGGIGITRLIRSMKMEGLL